MMLHLTILTLIAMELPTYLGVLVQYSRCWDNIHLSQGFGKFPSFHVEISAGWCYFTIKFTVVPLEEWCINQQLTPFSGAALEPSFDSDFLRKKHLGFVFFFPFAVTSMRINIPTRQREKKLPTPVMQLSKNQVRSCWGVLPKNKEVSAPWVLRLMFAESQNPLGWKRPPRSSTFDW